MHNLNPKDLPELKVVDITLSRAVVIFATIAIFFVLPVIGISYLQSHPVDLFPAQTQTETTAVQATPEPQVAGASTEASPSTNVLGIDMGSEQGLLLTIGVILVGISLVIVMFLAVENAKKR
ncbi:MAG: hypothetical protein ACMG57_05465 [Candidatus Dojkabacteria bacterium]